MYYCYSQLKEALNLQTTKSCYRYVVYGSLESLCTWGKNNL